MEDCEIIFPQKVKNKINVRGYLMVKDKSRNDSYYWCCEFRKSDNCKGRAVTKLVNGKHSLIKFVEHNHSPCASAASVAKIVHEVKMQAKSTRDRPRQIIQSCTICSPRYCTMSAFQKCAKEDHKAD